jgi:[pyruvate, water dikinase]-phosphate phosphotransferase / [pyruvate, water dikinase] kinase
MTDQIHIHLVSDATGETNHQIARACMVQFQGVRPTEHVWSLVRTSSHIEKILTAVEAYSGPVFFTLVDSELRRQLTEGCQKLKVPCVSVLDPVLDALGAYLGVESRGTPGRQHRMDAAYFERIEAMDFTLVHDDGQLTNDLAGADIIILGVSRTSKTPTSLYLANRGYKTANIPLVPNVPLPDQVIEASGPFIVGLTNDPVRLTQVRRNRMLMLNQKDETDYIDLEKVRREVTDARRLFRKHGWPVIDVTRRSIEETAAAVLQHYARFKGEEG